VTSLLGRMLRLSPESVPLEDLFTEAVAHLFETGPHLCLAWLEDTGLLFSGTVGVGEVHVRYSSRREHLRCTH
jgi:hypothetical protein